MYNDKNDKKKENKMKVLICLIRQQKRDFFFTKNLSKLIRKNICWMFNL